MTRRRAPGAEPHQYMVTDTDADSGAGQSETSVVQDIEVLEQELATMHAQYVRMAADFENFRRRKAQELTDRGRYASEEAALALLPVLDNLHRSLEHVPDGTATGVASFVGGIELVVRDFEAALERLGVVAVPAVGEPFDPSIHEAIGAEESQDVEYDTVITELQRGYRLHDRVLRPSVVRIAHPASPGA